MAVSKRHPLINSVVTGRITQPTQPKQDVVSGWVPPPVYFNIEIPDAAMSEDEVWLLHPGTSYCVRVTTSFNALEGQKQVIVSGPITISLQSSHPALTVDKVDHTVWPETHIQEEYEFAIHVNEICPKDEVHLLLRYVETRSIRKKDASTLSIRLEGREEYSPLVQRLYEKTYINTSVSLPDNTAILHVVASSTGILHLQGWNQKTSLFNTEIPAFADTSLAKFVEGDDWPKEIRWKLHEFSRRSLLNLLAWFEQLYTHYGEGFGLVIADQTALELPWELLEIQDNEYLGVLARIIRWVPITRFTVHHHLAIQPEHYTGDMIAYVDTVGIAHSDHEHDRLLKCCTPYTSLQDLLTRLKKPLDSVALIYLACHGMFTYNDKYKTAVGSLHNPSQRVLALDLAELAEQVDKQTLIFINACHSARLIADKAGLYGLPEIILSRLANGYIGTVGPVGSKTAQQVSEQMLDAAQKNAEGVNIAEILRQMRVSAAQGILHNPPKDDDAWFQFLYTFMYVYYGNPLAQLTLHSRIQGDVHD